MTTDTERPPVLRARGIVKAFGSVVALDGVDLEVLEDEIVGLVGDNGAGKSTLIKVISGNFQPDAGELELDGRPIRLTGPADARAAGIETVYQDLSLAPNLDATANFFIGRELVRNVLGFRMLRVRDMERETRRAMDSMGIKLPSIRERVEFLSGGQRQAVSLARFLEWGRRLILLDEPTAALGVRETGEALDLIARMHHEKHVSMVLISHNLQHVFRIADRIVVLRHGRVAGVRRTADTDPDEIVRLITGASLMAARPSVEGVTDAHA
jgi:ABC-type sugar transport system ATPase subunit